MSVENVSVITTTIGFAVAVLLGCIKVWIPGTGAAQDSTVRLLALVLSIAASVGHYLLNNGSAPVSGPGLEGAVGLGFTAGIAAMATYHLYNGDVQAILSSVAGSPSPARVPIGQIPPAEPLPSAGG